MRSLGTVLMKICSIFVAIIAQTSDFDELKGMIESTNVKNIPGFKVSKFTLQISVFVYQKLMDFPSGRFDFDALTTQKLFESVRRVVNVKIYLHRSYVIVKILGYARDFCTMQKRTNFPVLLTTFLDLIYFFCSKEFDFWCGERKT